MKEYIEREAVLDLQHRLYHSPLSTVVELSPTYIISPEAVQRIPAADVAPVRHGRWKNGHCTSCGEDVASRLDIWTNIQRFSFCPFCGARMDGDGE